MRECRGFMLELQVQDERRKDDIMSNTNNTSVKYYGIFYIHPITGKRCRISRTFTSEAGAARACEKRNTPWGNLNFFYAEVPA